MFPLNIGTLSLIVFVEILGGIFHYVLIRLMKSILRGSIQDHSYPEHGIVHRFPIEDNHPKRRTQRTLILNYNMGRSKVMGGPISFSALLYNITPTPLLFISSVGTWQSCHMWYISFFSYSFLISLFFILFNLLIFLFYSLFFYLS